MTVLPDEPFTQLTSIKVIPRIVVEQMEKVGPKPSEMAEPGGVFAGGCVVSPGDKMARLLFAGLSKNHCFIYYEHGGIAHMYRIVLFKITGDKAEKVGDMYVDWRIAQKANSIDELAKALKQAAKDKPAK